MYFLKLL
jgi:hypothetical protein